MLLKSWVSRMYLVDLTGDKTRSVALWIFEDDGFDVESRR